MRAGKASAAVLLAALAVALCPAAAPAQSGSVYVIGDSLEVGTSPYLPQYLSGFSVRVDADESRSSSAAVEILRQRLSPSDTIVVFDLGTNDDPSQTGALRSELAEVGELVGDRCLVVATIHRPPYNGVSYDGFNGVIESFASSRPNTQLVDWNSYAGAHPDLLYSDGVHPTSSGYSLRARLIAEGIQSCVGGAPGAAAAGPAAPPSDAESPFSPTVARRVQNLLMERALAARLVSMVYLRELRSIAEAPGQRAAAFLVGLATFAPSGPAPLNRR